MVYAKTDLTKWASKNLWDVSPFQPDRHTLHIWNSPSNTAGFPVHKYWMPVDRAPFWLPEAEFSFSVSCLSWTRRKNARHAASGRARRPVDHQRAGLPLRLLSCCPRRGKGGTGLGERALPHPPPGGAVRQNSLVAGRGRDGSEHFGAKAPRYLPQPNLQMPQSLLGSGVAA